MNETADRIKELRTTLNLSQRQFARRILTSQTLVNEIELGKRKINVRILHLIAYKFKTSLEWLKNGKGDMFMELPQDVRLENIIDAFNKLEEPLKDCLLAQAKELVKLQKAMTDKAK